MTRTGFLTHLAALLVLLPHTSLASGDGVLEEVRDFGENPGNLQMLMHVPPDLPRRAPLVVVAHGCFQDAAEIARMSGWLELADAHGFALVFPQTSRANESFGGCFRTWVPEHQERGRGEPLSVTQMIQWMIERHDVDQRRVFITGLSSGGHLTNVMLATYPDLFAAGAPQSAFPYKCALSFDDVAPCCRAEKTHTRRQWGDLARSGFPGYRGPRPRVAIWHGSADPLLVVMNLTHQMQQWTDALGTDDVPDDLVFTDGVARIAYHDSARRPRVQTVTVPGMGHAVAIDTTAQPVKCGEARPFAADIRVCAAASIARWFGILP